MKAINVNQFIGQSFGRWTVVSVGQSRKYSKGWFKYVNCVCSCGKEKEVELGSLRQGKSTSCGCYSAELATKNMTKHGLLVGLKGHSPEYQIWTQMKGRCLNINDSRFKDYGGRGIKVCDRWLNSFQSFIEDLGNRPDRTYSLERINVNGDYCPENCKWILKSLQSKNTRRVKVIEYKGENYCLTELCRKLRLPYSTMRHRIYDLGMPFLEAMKYPQYHNCKNPEKRVIRPMKRLNKI